MTTRLNPINQNYEQLISALQKDIGENQERIKETINQLPSIAVTMLHAHPSLLRGSELLEKAKKLSVQAESIEDKSEKIALLQQVFALYKKFIKLNKQEINQNLIKTAARSAVDIGADIIDYLEGENLSKKEAMQLAIRKIQIISGYSDALYYNSLNQTVDALNIPQRHFAVTSQSVGTTHVKDCIFLVLRSEKISEVFAAHIDRHTDSSSISKAIRTYVPKGLVDAYVIGGHLSNSTILDYNCVNVLKISSLLMKLSNKGYAFNSFWKILQQDVPVNIVYYPENNQFFSAVPKKELLSYCSCEILIHLDQEIKSLLPYFIDQEERQTECSVELSPSVQKKLFEILEKHEFSKAKILNFIWENLPPSLLTYNRLNSVVTAYIEALQTLSSLVAKACPHASDESIQEALVDVLKDNQKNFLYILPFSKEKNNPLILEVIAVLSADTANSGSSSEHS